MEIQIIYENHLCGVCSYKCINRRSLGNHIARSHRDEFPIGLKDYVQRFFYKGIEPLCKCGCNKSVKWNKMLNHFNIYLSGHNDGFTSTNQPKLTKNQIANRNLSIKKRYDNDPELKQRISVSVNAKIAANKALDPFYYSNIISRLWQNKEIRDRLLESRKIQWEGESGIARRESMANPEVGRKISQSNANNDLNHTSQEEIDFISYLKTVFGDQAVSAQWVNLSERSLKPDAFLNEKNIFIEHDGVYWHGLDTRNNWKLQQIKHITNDLNKNKLAKDKKFNLIRIDSIIAKLAIKENLIKTYDDIIDIAYHVVIDGNILKEGSFKLDDDHHPIFTREQCIRFNETELFPNAPGREKMKSSVLPLMKKFWKNYVEYWGWFYPDKNIETAESIISKINSKSFSASKISLTNPIGNTWLKSRFNSYWNVKNGPKEAFNDSNCLDKVLQYRLGLNNSMDYSYKLKNDSIVKCRETFDINIENIRFGFVVQRKAVSFFKPTTACDLYLQFLKETEKPKVWDPSSGFGGRMLGFASALKDRPGEYWGCEPASEMFADLEKLKEELQQANEKIEYKIFNQGSEKIILPNDYFDFVFTSPPYFDKEQYFDESGQCWRDYPDMNEWKDKYLRKTYETAFRALKPGCKMVINFDDKCAPISRKLAIQLGFKHLETIELNNRPDHFMKKNGKMSGKTEFFDVFQKPIYQSSLTTPSSSSISSPENGAGGFFSKIMSTKCPMSSHKSPS